VWPTGGWTLRIARSMRTRWAQSRAWVLLGVAALVVAVSLLSRSAGALSGIERGTIDARFALRGGHAEPSVAVVALDTQSYIHLPRPPLPRTLDAAVIDHLRAAGARVIALDLALEQAGPSRAADEAVITALEQAHRAVVSVTAVAPGGVTEPLAGRVPFSRAPGVHPGTTFLIPDPDGSIRNFPSGFHDVQTLAIVAAELATGRRIATPARALIDYGGPAGTVRTIPLIDVLHNHFPASQVRGRIVVIGNSAPVLDDIHETPADGGGVMPGPEIQADAAQTALDGFPLRLAAPGLSVALLILVGLALPAASLGLGPLRLDGLRLVGAGIAAVALWSVAAQLAFDGGIVLDYTDGLLALVLGTVLTWAVTTAGERRERAQLRARFAEGDSELATAVLDPDRDAPLEPDRVIAGFRLRERLGAGGMGVVYRATQLQLERDVALKLILREHADDPDYRERFKQESLNAAAISHQNIVPVFGAGEDAGLLFLVMQLVDEPNLKQWLKNLGALEPRHAGRLMLQLGAALDAAHNPPRVLVHRDVKPANVLMLTDGSEHAYLTDFGLAINAETAARVTHRGGGTPDYMAPEQITGEPVGPLADVYALSALLYHCLTGEVPFPRENPTATLWAHVNARRPSARARRPELPEAIDGVIARGMALAPEERYPTTGTFAMAAAAALGVPVRTD
jgi:CHASE2 domain-containing sensor protein